MRVRVRRILRQKAHVRAKCVRGNISKCEVRACEVKYIAPNILPNSGFNFQCLFPFTKSISTCNILVWNQAMLLKLMVSPPLPQKILVVTRFGNFPDNNVCLWHTETDSLQSWILYRARLHIQNIYVILHIIYNQLPIYRVYPNIVFLM